MTGFEVERVVWPKRCADFGLQVRKQVDRAFRIACLSAEHGLPVADAEHIAVVWAEPLDSGGKEIV
jgi:hypothetical protein